MSRHVKAGRPLVRSGRARHAQHQGSWLLAAGIVAFACFAATLVPWGSEADAADETGLITTASTQSVAWKDAPHVGDDGDTGKPVGKALADWELRVSQTKDLLNQTVQVSWKGATDGGVLQLMQCWSAGPTVRPTREQCAYGGNVSGNQGSFRSRAIAPDPREATYFRAPELNVVAVGGKVPVFGAALTKDSELTLGNPTQTCPTGTTAYSVTLTPPRDAIAARKLPAKVTIAASTAGVPGSLTLDRAGRELVYKTVTKPFSLASVATAGGFGAYPLGRYRFDLLCTGAPDASQSDFVTFLDHAESGPSTVWRSAGVGGISVPFDPLGDTVDDTPTDPFLAEDVLDYLKPRTTNEVVEARSRPDRAGAVFMELFTDLEAQHLGCGRVQAAGPRSCWLVAVPRWAPEPNGDAYNPTTAVSPLSQSVWDRRLEVPLAFAPVDSGCSVGTGLKQLLTNDSAVAVLRSWQPTFCGSASTASSVLGPIQDDDIRNGLSEPNRLGVVTVPPATGRTLVKAPIATSGVVVAFVADRRLPFNDDKATTALDQTRTTTMNLTPRLVAKLLTQSYDSGAAPNGGKTEGYNSPPDFTGATEPTYTPKRSFPAANPRTLYDDSEFLAVNPDFKAWLDKGRGLVPPTQMADVLVSANDTDAYGLLWLWVLSDPDAKAFLTGAPDPFGMRINPYYKSRITPDLSSFPVLDPTCSDTIEDPVAKDFPLLCQPNLHPRVENDTQAAQAAIRGDTKRFNVTPAQLTGSRNELVYSAEARQEAGRLGMLVITTSAAAERFGLPTASLRNSSGQFVKPTVAALSAARGQAVRRPDGVALTDPSRVTGKGYPLTTTSYAVVDVAQTTQAQNSAFASVLDYAAGKGQRPGTAAGELPPGYAPLSAEQSAQTRAGAALLRNPASLLAGPAVTPDVTPARTTGGRGGSTTPREPGAVAGAVGASTTSSAPSLPAQGSTPPAAADRPTVLTSAPRPTPSTPAPVPLLPCLLVLGLIAAVAGRALPLLRRPTS